VIGSLNFLGHCMPTQKLLKLTVAVNTGCVTKPWLTTATTFPWLTVASSTWVINKNPLMCGSVDLVYNSWFWKKYSNATYFCLSLFCSLIWWPLKISPSKGEMTCLDDRSTIMQTFTSISCSVAQTSVFGQIHRKKEGKKEGRKN